MDNIKSKVELLDALNRLDEHVKYSEVIDRLENDLLLDMWTAIEQIRED